MRLWAILILVGTLVFFPLLSKPARATLSISDILSDVRPSVVSNHELKWTVSDASGIAEGEFFAVSFANQFGTSSIAVGDVDISDDGGDLTLAANCSGSEKVSFSNNGDDTFSFAICAGDGGTIATGSVVKINIGLNAVGGSNQVVNPGSAGSYSISVDGGSGYGDFAQLNVAILEGVSTTATVVPTTGNLQITGYASPTATVYFLEGGSVIGTAVANGSSYFDKSLTGLSAGVHQISIYAVDLNGRMTLTISFGVNVLSGMTVTVSGILLPSTISLTSNSVKRPAQLIGSGSARNNISVQLFISGSRDNLTMTLPTSESGSWQSNLNDKLHLGDKQVYAIAFDGLGGISEMSQTRIFDVLISADLNVDSYVNLTDFSILMYNYGTSTPPNVIADINDNGPVDLVDFSVMMYHWTGG